jgi:hypothetical protein
VRDGTRNWHRKGLPARRFLFDKVVYESAGRTGGNSRAPQGCDNVARSLRRLRGVSSSGDPISRAVRTELGVVDLSASGRVSGGALLSSGEAEDGSWWKGVPTGRSSLAGGGRRVLRPGNRATDVSVGKSAAEIP